MVSAVEWCSVPLPSTSLVGERRGGEQGREEEVGGRAETVGERGGGTTQGLLFYLSPQIGIWKVEPEKNLGVWAP